MLQKRAVMMSRLVVSRLSLGKWTVCLKNRKWLGGKQVLRKNTIVIVAERLVLMEGLAAKLRGVKQKFKITPIRKNQS